MIVCDTIIISTIVYRKRFILKPAQKIKNAVASNNKENRLNFKVGVPYSSFCYKSGTSF
jgi:hypothetical protein